MGEHKYYVKMDKTILAENMDIDIALLLVEAVTNKYYGWLSTGSLISIGEMDKETD